MDSSEILPDMLQHLIHFTLDRMNDLRRSGLIVYGLCCATASILAWIAIYAYIVQPTQRLQRDNPKSAVHSSDRVQGYSGSLPVARRGRWVEATITAYSPFETCPGGKLQNCRNAVGLQPREDVSIACPRRIRKGCEVMVGGRAYTCDDRTHERFDGRFDLFFEDHSVAKAFGKKELTIFIYQCV